jgi:hypothetical protein
MLNGSEAYANAARFRRGLEDRLKAQAKMRARSLEELRREFLFQRFLALVFSAPDRPWVLKGGASLLMRLDHARYSRDIDLLRLGESISPKQAVAELRQVVAPRVGDHLSFVIGEGLRFSEANSVVTISVTAYTGATKYGNFSIDISTDLHFLAPPERVQPQSVVEVPGMPKLPEMVVYPLTDQVADKVCAMYEKYGAAGGPSSRFRDLADLALIVTTCELDGQLTAAALASESRRRGMELPPRMVAPSPLWGAGYAATARASRLARELHQLDAALGVVAVCLDPLLSGAQTAGMWMPGQGWVNGQVG